MHARYFAPLCELHYLDQLPIVMANEINTPKPPNSRRVE
jgi:hypothetical protein